jgi:hypothetical protein
MRVPGPGKHRLRMVRPLAKEADSARKTGIQLRIAVHTYNPSTKVVEAGEF